MAIGGFSQGAMLVAQGLTRLREPPPKGAIFLSGLAVTFQAADVPCLALHGDCDDRVRLADAKLVQSKTHIPLEVFPGLGHEISDAVLDRVAAFCEEVLPVPERAIVVAKETPVLLQEARQAKLLRWVKKISQVITMFDDQRFMSHIVHLDMVALPAARQLGGGLVKYELHDAGPESRGLVVLFHGKQRNLREGARPLVEAYCRLKLSVCVIDYRQRFSQFCVDASVVLEELLGQQELPVLLHGAGCGGVHALHVAIASHSYPAQVARSLKLLVLDGSVANFRSLPPTPTGCIAVDPIGNDEKLKYIDLPVCILGGDDECCGYQVTQKHFTVLQRGAEMALPKSQVLAMDTGPALEGDRLGPALFAAVSKALDPVFMASWPSQSSASSRFFEDVLAGDEDATDALAQKFTPEVLSGLCQGALARARAPAAQLRLWELRADRGREGSWAEHVAALHQLERHGFSGGQKGFQEFEAVLSLHCQKDPALEAERRAVQEILDLRVLDAQVAKAEKQPGAHGVTLRQCYEVIESSLAEWLSEDKWRELLAAAQKEDGPPVRIARGVIRAASDDLTGRQARSLGVDSATLGAVYGHFCSVDPFLASRSAHLQEQIMQLSKKLTAEFPTPAAQPALAAQPQKAPKSGYKEQSEVEVLVHIDRDLNLFSKFKLPGGSTGTAVKEKVASFNAMGAAVFQLCLPSGRALGDKDLVTDGMELDVRDG
ncbi:unnamed protein product [Effrenium voratum]|nr:unnamed protein product [Effrenium voratum]